MTFFGLVFSLFEAIFLFSWFILFIVGCSVDRKGQEEFKWIVLFVGIIISAGIWWSDWTFGGIKNAIFSTEFWKPVMYFLIIGLVYAAIEFTIVIIQSARDTKRQWEKAKNLDYTKKQFVSSYYAGYTDIVELKYNSDKEEVVPTVNKSELSAFIGAWTCFWPFYLISRIIGDVLLEFWNFLAEFFSTLGGRFIKNAYKNIFN